jgi:outer membrane lipoprotein-sorting protein
MSLFSTHPLARWGVPATAVALIGGGAVVATQAASADPSLPSRTPAQLLVDVQQARLTAISGTVVQTSNLGLPDLPGMGGGGPGGGSSSLTSMVSGTHTWRLWYAGPQQARVALLGSLGESDIVRNGKDLWVWSSADKKATHTTLPAHADAPEPGRPGPTDLPKTPQEAADRALKALGPTTSVTTSGAAVVAGRSAYELVLAPKDRTSLIGQVRISVDAARHIPLRVQVFSTRAANPAFEVGFTSVDFAKPDPSRFTFNPPPGTAVTESRARPQAPSAAQRQDAADAAKAVRVVGTGWSTVAVATLPKEATAGAAGDRKGRSAGSLQGIVSALPKVSGSWGSGRLLKGTLFSVVVTDDGRVAVGAVTPDRLYAALAAK